MSKLRALVGTRKGAFILTSDGKREKWDVSGPHFAGWEMYHLKASPVDPNRIYASQTSKTTEDGGTPADTFQSSVPHSLPAHKQPLQNRGRPCASCRAEGSQISSPRLLHITLSIWRWLSGPHIFRLG
jgi:hypothetical protein